MVDNHSRVINWVSGTKLVYCGRTINRTVKKRVEMAGVAPTLFGAHSLRSGFITESGRKGASLQDAMALSCHSASDVAMGYYREGKLLRNPAAHLLG